LSLRARAEYSVAALAARVGARVVGDGEAPVRGIGALPVARGDELSHLSSPAFRRHLPATRAAAVLLRDEDAAACPVTSLVVADPYHAYALLSALFVRAPDAPPGVDPRAAVDTTASVGPGASIGPFSVVRAGARVGAGVRIGAHCAIGREAVLADGVVVHDHVVLYDGVQVGARSILHSGVVLGADGFGYARGPGGASVKIAQLGVVRIGADVEIGANTTIDCGALDDTVIGDGVKIDNQVQVGHNCVIGAHTVVCGCVGMAGSTRVGAHCVIAGGAGLGGDGPVSLADGVVVSGMTHVAQSVDSPGVISGGTLAQPTREWKRNALRLRELDALSRRLAALERRLGVPAR
jgi:UDP-3-O-[3-hydroxymyristoyl] glucosamine N-acyltransferase